MRGEERGANTRAFNEQLIRATAIESTINFTKSSRDRPLGRIFLHKY